MIKANIISGFLGAGKTTLISKLIKEAFSDEKVVLIENEFGEIGIDGGFLKESGIVINEMNSGCICCSLVGDFEESLKEVIKTYNPTRIIIEPSGVGKLSDVIKAVESVGGIEISSYSTVVDTNKARIYSKNFKEFFNDQVETASCVILSKTKNAEIEKLKETVEIVKLLNPLGRVITTDWDLLDGKEILKVMEGSVDLFKHECGCGHHDEHHHEHECGCSHHDEHHHEHECGCSHHDEHHHEHECGCGHHDEHHHEHECGCGHHDEHHHEHECGCGHHHHAEEHFTSIGIETINKYSKEDLQNILSQLDNSILRAKGIVQDYDEKWLFFDFVPEEIDIREGNPSYTGLITVIGTKDTDVDSIKKLFGVK